MIRQIVVIGVSVRTGWEREQRITYQLKNGLLNPYFQYILAPTRPKSALTRTASGVEGNEAADKRAKLRAYSGRVTNGTSLITPAGIRQDHPIHSKPRHLQWTRRQVKALTYIVTDRGPMKRWLFIIGRSAEQLCQCGEVQNATHLRRCHLIGDKKGRTIEECWKDQEWCDAVADFLST